MVLDVVEFIYRILTYNIKISKILYCSETYDIDIEFWSKLAAKNVIWSLRNHRSDPT